MNGPTPAGIWICPALTAFFALSALITYGILPRIEARRAARPQPKRRLPH